MIIDWSDPCQRARALRDAYFELLSGEKESLIRYRGPEGEREVRFPQAKLELLKSEMREAEDACAAASGIPSPGRRFAIRGGARRRCI